MDSDLELQAVLDQFEEGIKRELRELYEQRSARLEGLLAKLSARLVDSLETDNQVSSVASERMPLEELDDEKLVALFRSAEVRHEKTLALMRRIACEMASREHLSVLQVSGLSATRHRLASTEDQTRHRHARPPPGEFHDRRAGELRDRQPLTLGNNLIADSGGDQPQQVVRWHAQGR